MWFILTLGRLAYIVQMSSCLEKPPISGCCFIRPECMAHCRPSPPSVLNNDIYCYFTSQHVWHIEQRYLLVCVLPVIKSGAFIILAPVAAAGDDDDDALPW